MVFSSTVFLFLFLPLTLALYHGVRLELRNTVLLLASLVFYAWGELRFLPLLLGSIAGNYLLGLAVEKCRRDSPGLAKATVAIAVALNLGVLVRFKYATFLVDSVNGLLRWSHATSRSVALDAVTLPLGISFFTFHSLSYVIDVYRGHASAQRRLPLLALYILLFPQLVAGPIVRYHEISAQLTQRLVRIGDFARGAERFVIGLGKKVLIANTLAEVADGIFGLPQAELTFGLSWLGACAYTLQIYYDFSGYSDMAIGLARLFGFRFPENFDYPYVARSMTEFWQRWHLSLSRFFRDYLYIPLGGNRAGPARLYFNLSFVFLLCGLWHGAGWNFMVWGAAHGALLVLERVGFGAVLVRVRSPLRHVYCLLCVILTWVLFRATDLASAGSFLKAMLGFGAGGGVTYHPGLFLEQRSLLAFAVGIVACAPVLPRIARLAAGEKRLELSLPFHLVRAASLFALLLASTLRLSSGTYNPFIYFRF